MPTHGVHQNNQFYSSSRHSLTISGVFIKANIVRMKVLFQVIITINAVVHSNYFGWTSV